MGRKVEERGKVLVGKVGKGRFGKVSRKGAGLPLV